ncbi:shufflon protein D', partial [Klebsiella pneumoniae]
MLTSKEAKNNANNHSLQACQSGTWIKVGSGELQIATAQATSWRFPGATATCPTG